MCGANQKGTYKMQSQELTGEGHYKYLFEEIKDHAILTTDIEGIIQDWNSGAEKIFQIDRKEVIGKKASFIFTPEDVADRKPEEEMKLAIATGRAEDKRWHVRKDGTRFFANGIMNPLANEKGEVVGFVKVLRDDTIKRATELAAEKAQIELQNLFLQNPIPMALLLGPEHRYSLVNPPFAELSGRETLGKSVREVFTKDEGAGPFIEILDETYKTGKPFIGRELPFHRKDQNGEMKKFYLNVSFFPYKSADGTLEGIVAYLPDVTEQVESRKKIEASEAHFRLIANALPLIIWTANPEGLVDWYNDWWFEYLGSPRGTLWDDPEKQPMHPDDVIKTWPLWKESLATGKDFHIEQRFKRGKDGQYRWHKVHAVAVKNTDGEIIKWVGANTDIHDQKLLLEELHNEREIRDRFVAALSHDLRTPLTAAKMTAQLLNRKAGDVAAVHKSAVKIAENIDRADSMIQDLLDASRIKAGQSISVDKNECHLNQVAKETIDELSTVYGDRFKIIAQPNIVGFWSCNGIRRIIENLCTNAVKYGSSNTPVILSLEENQKCAFVKVHNMGEPISPEDQSKLFEPFRRMESAQSSKQKGWGLGLTLVKGLTEAHGGKISVESSLDRGTTFIVEIPKNT